MKLSTRSRYGLRFMCDLALHYGEGVMLLKEIARRMNISEKYLSNLALPLKGAGLVNAVRGSHGGYELLKSPEKVTVKEIYELLEGDPVILECITNETSCPQNFTCPTNKMWKALQQSIFDFMEGVTLQDLIEEYKSSETENVLMYHI
ncbi:MAG: Rrf2 family transcriptional regulator [Spirochaetales bacterium]|nr:Rrf2 family transcriptional regulator [Spirochaetales bacterium]